MLLWNSSRTRVIHVEDETQKQWSRYRKLAPSMIHNIQDFRSDGEVRKQKAELKFKLGFRGAIPTNLAPRSCDSQMPHDGAIVAYRMIIDWRGKNQDRIPCIRVIE